MREGLGLSTNGGMSWQRVEGVKKGVEWAVLTVDDGRSETEDVEGSEGHVRRRQEDFVLYALWSCFPLAIQ